MAKLNPEPWPQTEQAILAIINADPWRQIYRWLKSSMPTERTILVICLNDYRNSLSKRPIELMIRQKKQILSIIFCPDIPAFFHRRYDLICPPISANASIKIPLDGRIGLDNHNSLFEKKFEELTKPLLPRLNEENYRTVLWNCLTDYLDQIFGIEAARLTLFWNCKNLEQRYHISTTITS